MHQPETTSALIAPPAIGQRGWNIVLLLSFIYFAVRVSFYAFNIAPNVPPDEKAHFGISEVFANTWGLPVDSDDSYRYGLITHVPNLYYYLMGRVANANFLFGSDLPLLRLANALMGMLTVWVGYLWMRRITSSKLAACLFVVVITNIPMFTFLCGSVNYDNLVNLLAALGVYFLTRFLQTRRPGDLAAFLIAICLGTLTKVAFLPLAGFLVIALLWHEWRQLRRLPALVAQSLRGWSARGAALTMLVLLLVGTNVFLYGSNLKRYGLLVPVVQQVLTTEQSMQNPVFARDYITAAFRDGRITAAEAMMMTDKIDDPSIKQGTIDLLNEALRFRKSDVPQAKPPAKAADTTTIAAKTAEKKTSTTTAKAPAESIAPTDSEPELASRARYFLFWIAQMGATTFGILGQISIFRPTWQLCVYGAILAIALLVFVVTRFVPRWRRHPDFDRRVSHWLFAGIVLAYTAVLVRHNYISYLRTGMGVLAVQGRYLFPVLVPMYGLMVCYLISYWPRRVQWLIAVMTAAWFVAGDFPFVLSNASPAWFTAPATPSANAAANERIPRAAAESMRNASSDGIRPAEYASGPAGETTQIVSGRPSLSPQRRQISLQRFMTIRTPSRVKQPRVWPNSIGEAQLALVE